MTILKDLLALRAEKPPVVAEDEQLNEVKSLSGLIEKYTDQEKMYSWEGPRGVRNLTKLVAVLDYRSLDAFFEDNSGAIEAVVEWIGKMSQLEWRQALEDELHDKGDEDDDE